MVFKMIPSVSTMGLFRPQRVVFSFFHLLLSLNLLFFSITASFPILKLSHVTTHICHPTRSRDAALLLNTAGDHLPYAYMWESVCFLSHRAIHNIRRSNIPPLKSVSSLCLFRLVLLFRLCCLHSDESLNRDFLSACLLWHKCVQMCVQQSQKHSDQFVSFDHTQSSAVSFCLSALSTICVH